MTMIDNIVSGTWLLIHAWGVQLLKYSAGLVLHMGILAGLVEFAGIHYTLAFMAALPCTLGAKFLLNQYWWTYFGQKRLETKLPDGDDGPLRELVAQGLSTGGYNPPGSSGRYE